MLTRSDHFCQRTRLPSTVKLGPSGWVISSGWRSVRSGRVLGVVAAGLGRQRHHPVSTTSRTSPRPMSTKAISPSIGRA